MGAVGERFSATLACAQAGDGGAVAVLFRAHQPSLLAYLRSYERTEADDIAAEVWLAVARGLGSFSGDESGFRGWLFTIARRRLADHRRRQGRRPVTLRAPADLDGAGATAPSAEATAVPKLAAAEARRRVQELLSPDQAEVVLLRVVADLDVAEVAQIMGRSPGAIRVLQHRALRRLASALGDQVVTP